MDKENFDIIYSLGFNCDCASFLKKYNLRSCAGPFDWVGVSSFAQRINLILNDFEDFLVYHDLERICPLDGFKDAYQSKKTNMSFRHDFGTSSDLSKSFNAVKEKYQRRIERFYKNISESEKILFVYMATNEKLSKETLLNTFDLLKAKLNKDIHLTIIQQDDAIPRGEINTEELSPNLKSYHLDFYNSVEIIDRNAAKLLKGIFSTYECKKIPHSLFAKILKALNLHD